MMAGRLLLPSSNALKLTGRAQGWRIATAVRPSLIPGAGNGRFACEAVKAGDIVGVKHVLDMRNVSSLLTVAPDTVASFESQDELEAWAALAEAEGGFDREEVLNLFENFVWSLDGTYSGRACLNTSTWTVNHGAGADANIEWYEERSRSSSDEVESFYVGEAMVDIEPETELRQDYGEFRMPHWYLGFCRSHGFEDVRASTLAAAEEKIHSE